MADEATERWLDFVSGLEDQLATALALFREAGAADDPPQAGTPEPSHAAPGSPEPDDAELVDALLGAWTLSERLHGLLKRCGVEAEMPSAPPVTTTPAPTTLLR